MGYATGALENMEMTPAFWKNRSVLITGHTGFKGSWLSLWLDQLGAKIHGYALNPPTQPNLFDVANIQSILSSDVRADLADIVQLKSVMNRIKPEIIFHLAAQPLVRHSYQYPLETIETNVLGTAHLLQAIRGIDSIAAVVIITTDKVYANKNPAYPFSENDALGGYDIYSASKAAAEIIVDSYRHSFFNYPGAPLITTVRAGNVIGGGDWAVDRLVPDCLRALDGNQPLFLRFPHAIRPWQHVLEPLAGYLQLAEKLVSAEGVQFASPWNFGPDKNDEATVETIVNKIAELSGNKLKIEFDSDTTHFVETVTLKLDSSRARALFWRPRWNLEDALKQTITWHQAWKQNADMFKISNNQLIEYLRG